VQCCYRSIIIDVVTEHSDSQYSTFVLVMLSTQKSYTLLCRAQMEQSKTKYTCFAIKHSKQILYYFCFNIPETGIEQNPKVSVDIQMVDGS